MKTERTRQAKEASYSGNKDLLGIPDLQKMGLGRDTARGLSYYLPAIIVGSNRRIRRSDLEAFLERAAREGLDIRAIAMSALKAALPTETAEERQPYPRKVKKAAA
jgi:hypothetical protein